MWIAEDFSFVNIAEQGKVRNKLYMAASEDLKDVIRGMEGKCNLLKMEVGGRKQYEEGKGESSVYNLWEKQLAVVNKYVEVIEPYVDLDHIIGLRDLFRGFVRSMERGTGNI